MRPLGPILVGVLLGALLAEAGLRLYFPEYMADRSYWGRGTFAEAPDLPYRHAADVTTVVGREGVFGPHRVRTNALGYRDARVPAPDKRATRVVVVGASFMFGVGVERDEDLFHVKLEEILRRRPDWPTNVEVYNLAQTGYVVGSMIELTVLELDRFDPDLVLMVLSSRAWIEGEEDRRDVVGGYRLDPARLLANTPLDELRTRSFSWLRATPPWEGGASAHLDRLSAWLRLGAQGGGSEADARWFEHVDHQIGRLVALEELLIAHGVDFQIVPIGVRSVGVARSLVSNGLPVIAIRSPGEWELSGPDAHWSSVGHREAARLVGLRLPPPASVDR